VTSSEPTARGSRRVTIIVAVLIGLTLIGRVISSGQAALEDGHAALAAGNELGATVAYREAVSWYLPLAAPWRDQAADALWDLHLTQLEAKRTPAAVQSLQSLRAGLRSADSLWRPDGERKQRVDAALAPLMAAWEAEDAQASGRTIPGELATRAAHHAQLLAQDERPSRPWGLLAVLGFGLWVGAATKGLSQGGPARRRLLALSFAGLVAFLTGLILA
jgi:hypothetical protein